MKSAFRTLLSLLLLCVPVLASASLEDDVTSVNTNWKNENHAAILQLINTRLSSDSDDVFATTLKAYYYIFADCNLVNARAAADTLVTIANGQSNTEVSNLLIGIKNEIYAIPLSEDGAYSQAQTDAIHTAFPNTFPNIKLCYGLANTIDPD